MARPPSEGNEALSRVQVQSRLWTEDREAIEKLATEAGTSVSRFVRWLVRGALEAGLGRRTVEELKQDGEADRDAA